MFILTYLTIFLILFCGETFGLLDSDEGDEPDPGWGLFLSVSQRNDEVPSYDIGHWTNQLHLQQCAFVEIGEEFCALFVELRSIPSAEKISDSSGVSEFFLGLCECATVRSWILCSDQLMRRRKADCIFTEAIPSVNTSSRVHRRLCDVTLLTKYAEPCNCSVSMANQQLYRTEGFPTCFRTPLPESICSPRGVCGVAQCCAITIEGIHSPQCDPECHERQPFCEELGPWTSIPPQITSLWSHWSTPVCMNSDGRVLATSTAICRNQATGQPAIDCIGPGSFCCPVDAESCTCIVTNENGILKAIRMVESTLCILDVKKDGARIVRKANLNYKRNKNYKQNQDQEYDHSYQDSFGDQETIPDLQSPILERTEYQFDSEYEDLTSPFRRRLMFSRYDYSEDRDRSFDRGAEFIGSDNVAVNDEIADDDDDDDEDDEEEDEGDGDMGDMGDMEGVEDVDNVEDMEADDDGELAESDEGDDYAESSESDEYVRRARDPNTRKSGFKWANERPPRFVRSNPSMCAAHPKKREGGVKSVRNTGSDKECDEPEEGSGIQGPLQYVDYDLDAAGGNNFGKGKSDSDDIASLAVIGPTLGYRNPFYLFTIYTCIALCS